MCSGFWYDRGKPHYMDFEKAAILHFSELYQGHFREVWLLLINRMRMIRVKKRATALKM